MHLQGTTSAKFYPLDGGQPSVTAVRMEGELDTAHHTASVNIWIGDAKYRILTAKADAAAAQRVAQQSLDATTRHDWSALYDLLSKDIQAAVTPADFSATMSTTDITTTKAEANGTGTMRVVGSTTLYRQPVTLTVKQKDGTIATYHNNRYLVLEGDEWKLLSTDTPKQ